MPNTTFTALAALAPDSIVALGRTPDGHAVVRAGTGPDGERLDYVIRGNEASAFDGETILHDQADSVIIDDNMITVIARRRASFDHALIEALFGGTPPGSSTETVLDTATRWIALLPDATRKEVKFGLTVLEFWLGGSFPQMSIADRQQRLEDRVINAGLGLIRQLGRLRTIFYSAHYQTPAAWQSIGFTPPQQRPGAPAFSSKSDLDTVQLTGDEPCDWLIIGSGSGGAAAAAALAPHDDVIVIEKGDYWSTAELTHRDAEQYARLYAGGGLMASSNREIAILQAECVGGSSLVNNAICFRPDSAGIHRDAPDAILQFWEATRAHVDRAKVTAAFDHLWQRLDIGTIRDEIVGANGRHLENAWQAFLGSGHARTSDVQAPVGKFQKNYGSGDRKCWGCGYCNSGCPYDRKDSVVQTLLKDAEADGAKIAANTIAHRINIDDRLHGKPVKSVQVRQNGNAIRIRPRKGTIIAAGTGASSKLLERYDVANVGKRISCNLACPVVAKMPDKQDSWNGVQMATYVDRGDHLIESWFHPPATFAASVGGWFGEYVERMEAYSNLVCLGILMPVSDIGEFDDGRFNVELKSHHREQLRSHIVDVVRMHFAGGAEQVYLPTSKNVTVDSADGIEAVVDDTFREGHDFIVSTSHPQGGNVMGRWSGNSVVGNDLRVHGHENLYIADASIFPSSVRINAQMWVMAMAHATFARA